MMKFMMLWVCLLVCQLTFAQQSAEALEDQQSYTLRERYGIMKAKSQSYKDYKVIKESVLDGVWKITRDSMAAKDVAIRQAKQNIAGLNKQLADVNNALKRKEASMTAVLFDSTHIAVLGIDIPKTVFLSIVGIVILALTLLIITFFGRMKLLAKSVQEKKLAITLLTNEYEDYKKKAMDKQTKLSRELQDERNRLQAIRNA